jgi:hypothetical protein
MSKKQYTLEEKRRAIEQYGEKINYSARYSGECFVTILIHS